MRNFFQCFLYILLMCIFIDYGYAEQVPLAITPYPNQIEFKKGTVDFSGGYQLSGNGLIETFRKMMKELQNPLQNTKNSVKINIVIGSVKLQAEGYELNVSQSKVNINATTKQGAFYAIQSLKQLLYNSKKVLALVIKDEPRLCRSWMDAFYTKKKLSDLT